jgi:uncharacterized protein (TIGR02284 family)
MTMNNDDVVSTLNDLIETSKDGEYGFRSCADHAESPELKTLFNSRAEDCQKAARELQEQVVKFGGEPDTSGSATGALHRGWVAIRSTLSTYDDLAVLEECERGEDTAVESYEEALHEQLPESVRQLVERHYQGVQRNHALIHQLRDARKS